MNDGNSNVCTECGSVGEPGAPWLNGPDKGQWVCHDCGSEFDKDSDDDGLQQWEVSGVVRTVAPFTVTIVASSEEEARELAEDEARSSLTGQSWSDVDVTEASPEEK